MIILLIIIINNIVIVKIRDCFPLRAIMLKIGLYLNPYKIFI